MAGPGYANNFACELGNYCHVTRHGVGDVLRRVAGHASAQVRINWHFLGPNIYHDLWSYSVVNGFVRSPSTRGSAYSWQHLERCLLMLPSHQAGRGRRFGAGL